MADGSLRNTHESFVDITGLLERRDAAALGELMRWYRPLLRALADRKLDAIVRTRIDPSDVVQEACGDVVAAIHRVESKSRQQFWGYLKETLINKIHDVRRRFVLAEKRSIVRENRDFCRADGMEAWVDHCIEQPLDVLIHDETCRSVLLALGRLPRELKRLLRWRFRKGMTYKEIGQRVGRSEDDVRMLITRCLARVRKEVMADVSH
jgi:RNA polymerase sigma factor (sigma-70 family)